MAWLLWALPVTVLVILVIPLRVQLTFCAGLEWQAKLRASWAFWKLGKKANRRQKQKKARDDGKQAEHKKGHSRRLKLTPAQIYQLADKYIPRIWRALHLRCDYLDIDILFDDPSLMGYAYAFCGATGWPPEPVSLSAGLAEETVFNIEGCIEAKLYPAQVLALLLHVGFEPPVRRLWWRKRKGETRNARSKDTWRAAGKHDFQQDGNRRSNISG